MAPAPWDSIPPQDKLFVLVTGANSGIGFGIGERLIDEFLTTRPLTAHLVLIPTTRSESKSALTISGLREHAKKFATTSKALRSRVGPSYNPRDATKRVHLLSIQIDLCQFTSIRKAADQLINGTLTSIYQDDDFFESLQDIKIPRLDAVIFNAGIGGWYGLDWPKVFHNIFTKGLLQATTYPTFKGSLGGHLTKPLSNTKSKAANEVMGEVFCANVFGHYMFAHRLVPLLQRKADVSKTLNPGRIIWESSVEPVWKNFDLEDFQAIKNPAAYESSKRLTDILAITATLPACQPFVKNFLQIDDSEKKDTAIVPPNQYLAHPGIVQTTIFPLGAFLFFWYKVVLYLVRWMGSPWHCVTSYNGALSPVWLALEQQEALDAAHAERSKWGSAINRLGRQRAKKDEVEGWGWDGKVESPSVTRKITGRRPDAVDLTEERRIEFEALGAECWREMERLRKEWESRLNEV
ncbi:3-keto-steroid reductase [Rhypophila decipiens]|uniref:3-keto-steroid reductase n=1 Tax=Rhypophila decipiens TaxID=261697 RepID=A0AAN6YNG8_9PEZI|nr:3-keto-steroid reductase [Rhypophila decipiens]